MEEFNRPPVPSVILEADADTERSEGEADAEGSMHFFDSACPVAQRLVR